LEEARRRLHEIYGVVRVATKVEKDSDSEEGSDAEEENNSMEECLEEAEEDESEQKLYSEIRKKKLDLVRKIVESDEKLRIKLGIENLSDYTFETKEEGCIDGAILRHKTNPSKTIYFKLSTSTHVKQTDDGQLIEEERDFNGNLYTDYAVFKVLRELGCSVPQVEIFEYSNDKGKKSFLFASIGVVQSATNLASVFSREDTETLNSMCEEPKKKDEKKPEITHINYNRFMRTCILLFLASAQDLNLDNLMLSKEGQICCIDANFEELYDDLYRTIRDSESKKYNSLPNKKFGELISSSDLADKRENNPVLNALFTLNNKISDPKQRSTRLGLLVTLLFYTNQLSQSMYPDQDFEKMSPNERIGYVAFHPLFQEILFRNSEMEFIKTMEDIKNSLEEKIKDESTPIREARVLCYMQQRLGVLQKFIEVGLPSLTPNPQTEKVHK
jgi:hypothetical protein